MNNPYAFIILGALTIWWGVDIAKTKTFIRVDTFPAFSWAGWIMAAFGVLILCYGLQRAYHGLRPRRDRVKDRAQSDTTDSRDS